MWCGSFVAIKKPSNGIPPDLLQKFVDEVQIMTLFHHPNIVIFLGACITEPNICLLLEYCEHGDMKQFLKAQKKMINTHILHRFATDVARGMKYLHIRLNLVQRDLKTQNLLVDHNHNVKISDFGLTKKEDNKLKTSCGTPYYAAPEVVRGEMYDLSADVYSFAIVLWELVTLDEPYDGMDPLQAAHAAAQNGLRPKIPFICPDEYAKLMRDCWVDCPESRPTFEEILNRLVEIKKELYENKSSSQNHRGGGISPSDGKSEDSNSKSMDASLRNIADFGRSMSSSHNEITTLVKADAPRDPEGEAGKSSKSVGAIR
jgi:serine/threonine-protein kinase CTR1